MNPMHDIIIIGAGVAGICQLKHLVDGGHDAVVLEAHDDLGGTWFNNRYPGCRFDSESYTYGYKYWPELLEKWDWKEHFSAQPDNLEYLNFVVDTFGLREHFRFNKRVSALEWSEENRVWTVRLTDGEVLTARFVVSCLGVLSVPFTPQIEGSSDFGGESFHTFDWPADGIDLTDKNVGVVGTGATGIQVISEIADKTRSLTVFQRSANWSVPLNNAPISPDEMADLRSRYEEIFAICARTNGSFCHPPHEHGFAEDSEAERKALWDALYDKRGFSMLVSNYRETFFDEAANKELSDYVADRIRQRVDDPRIAEILIPKDHGFGMKRLPLETRYFEAYNRENVSLVDLSETPIARVTATGVETTPKTGADTQVSEHPLDVLIFATGFEAITGPFNKLDIRGNEGLKLKDKWDEVSATFLGVMTHGFPNFLMVAGPQSVSGSTNYPPAIENTAEWIGALMAHAKAQGFTRIEASEEGEAMWQGEVIKMQELMPFSKVRSWFTGFNPNATEGTSPFRYNAYWGGAPKYRKFLSREAEDYAQIAMD